MISAGKDNLMDELTKRENLPDSLQSEDTYRSIRGDDASFGHLHV